MVELHRSNVENQEQLLEYLSRDPLVNTFAIADVSFYGMESAFQDVYFQQDEHGYQGVYVRYCSTIIVAADPKTIDPQAISSLIDAQTTTIMGPARTIRNLRNWLQAHRFTPQFTASNLYQLPDPLSSSRPQIPIRTATEEDVLQIHRFLQSIPELRSLYPDPRMIVNRMRSGEGVHVIVENEAGEIIAHGNTAATTEYAAMIGGVGVSTKFRRRGIATEIVSFLSGLIQNSRRTPCALSAQPPGHSIFDSLGFHHLIDWGILTLTSISTSAVNQT